jgi:filamentous hemagglutinin
LSLGNDDTASHQAHSFQLSVGTTLGSSSADIQNSASYSAESSQVTVGTSAGSSGAGFGNDSGSAASTTQAGISGIAGNTAARTGDAETGINKIFNQQAVAENVNAQVQITQTAGQQVPKATATAMDKQANDLITQARAEPDSTKRKALLDEAAKYQEGGSYRIAAHTLFGALSGGVGGAAAAGTVAANAQNLNDLQDQLAKSLTNAGVEEKTAKAIANVSFNVGTLVAGNAVGGGAGATAALNVDANNRQLHPTEIQWIKSNAAAYAKQKGISVDAAEKQLAEQAFRQVQFGAEGGAAAWDSDAQNFLKNAAPQSLAGGGFMFYATPDQKADATMYLNSAISNADFYAKNGLQQPTQADLQNAAMRDAQIRANLGTATKTAFAASASIALAGLAPTTLRWALSHPVEATTAGIITAETAAAITSGAVTPTTLAPMLSAGGMKAVATMGEAVAGQAAAATGGGFINASKVCQVGCAIGGLTAQEQALATAIKNGQDSTGAITETLLKSVAQRTGMEVLDGGKYGANKGFDLVLKGKDGAVTVILDGKQFTASGAVSLSANGAGNTNQLSPGWIEEVILRLGGNTPAANAIRQAQKDGTLTTAVGGVNRTTGELVVLPVTVPDKK